MVPSCPAPRCPRVRPGSADSKGLRPLPPTPKKKIEFKFAFELEFDFDLKCEFKLEFAFKLKFA